jgi:hypothetical protein
VDVRAGQQQGAPACTYFVKLLRHPRLWPQLDQIPTAARRKEFVAFLPWRFELDMYECGIVQALPPGMRTPVLHHVKHVDADHIALWWEYITERAGPWCLADYRRAARMLGRLAARRRAGAEINLLMPERARSSPPLEALRYYTESRVLLGAVPMLAAGQIWRHPVAAAALRRAADPGLQADLRAEGYESDPDQVRAGYVGSLAARSALCALPAELLTSAAPDEATEDLFLHRLRLTRAMVDMAAEI